MTIAEDLELGVEVEVQEYEASKCGSGMAGREGFQGVVDVIFVARADLAVVHDAGQAIALLRSCNRDIRFADSWVSSAHVS